MPVSLNKSLLGFNVPINGVASTIAELVEFAGSEERALAHANNYVNYHVFYSTVRDKIVETLESLTGIKRRTKKSEKTQKEIIDETNEEYTDRLEEELGEGYYAQYADEVAAAVNLLKVDYTVKVRTGGGGAKLAKKWLDSYDQLAATPGKIDRLVEKYELDLEGLSEEAAKIVVAQKIKELTLAHEAKIKAQAKNEALAGI